MNCSVISPICLEEDKRIYFFDNVSVDYKKDLKKNLDKVITYLLENKIKLENIDIPNSEINLSKTTINEHDNLYVLMLVCVSKNINMNSVIFSETTKKIDESILKKLEKFLYKKDNRIINFKKKISIFELEYLVFNKKNLDVIFNIIHQYLEFTPSNIIKNKLSENVDILTEEIYLSNNQMYQNYKGFVIQKPTQTLKKSVMIAYIDEILNYSTLLNFETRKIFFSLIIRNQSNYSTLRFSVDLEKFLSSLDYNEGIDTTGLLLNLNSLKGENSVNN